MKKIKIVPKNSTADVNQMYSREQRVEIDKAQAPFELTMEKLVLTPVVRLSKQTGTHSISTDVGYAGNGSIDDLIDNLRNFGIDINVNGDDMVFTNRNSQPVTITLQAQGRSGRQYQRIPQENTSIDLDGKNATFTLAPAIASNTSSTDDGSWDFKYEDADGIHLGKSNPELYGDEKYLPSEILGFPFDGNMLRFDKQVKTLEIAPHIKQVRNSSFENQMTLYQLNLGQVEVIDNHAFDNLQNLTVLELPSTVKEIGVSAFANLHNLQKIIINATTPPKLTDGSAHPFVMAHRVFNHYSNNAEAGSIDVYVPDESLDLYKNQDEHWRDSADGTRIAGFNSANYLPMSELVTETPPPAVSVMPVDEPIIIEPTMSFR